jgi:hypothetical protein
LLFGFCLIELIVSLLTFLVMWLDLLISSLLFVELKDGLSLWFSP